MKGTAPTPNTPDVGRTSRCYSEEESQEKQTSQLLSVEKQVIVRREDVRPETERGVLPIKRLSHDILCHIFELLCKDSLPMTFPLNHQLWRLASLRPPQITLSHVCSAWRDIMLDVPTFWSCIQIVPRNLDIFDISRTFDSMVKDANNWLSRAKGLPCSIDIDFPDHDEYGDNHRSLWKRDWHENIIRDLISLHKFKRLGVTFADHHLRRLLQLPDDKLSCIEDLCLRYVTMIEDDTPSPLDLHKLSNLTSFSLLPNPFDPYPLSYPPEHYSKLVGIPWHNLRHIYLLATMPILFCLDALENCSTVLETCSLIITCDRTFTSSPRVPIYLFQLRALKVIVSSLRSRREDILELFLLSLRFPGLKSLTLALDYPTSSIDLQMLLRVQDASQMHLDELIISDMTLGVDVRTLLMGFPSLRRLELPATVTFTDEAMIEVGAGSIGIFLEDLTINNSALDLEKLLQMVKARSRAGDRDGKHQIEVTEFKSVTLHCNKAKDNMSDEVLYFMEEIKLSGVDLNVIFADHSDGESIFDEL